MGSIKHSYVMWGLLGLGVVLFLSGAVGSMVFLLWPLVCIAMMLAMMWGMRGGGHTDHKPNGVTHSAEEDLTRSGR